MLLSWNAAKNTCAQGFLQMAKLENITNTESITNTSLSDQETLPYWLGIYKNSSCNMQVVNDVEDVTQVKFENCPYVYGDNFTERSGDCDEKNRAICVKPEGETAVFHDFINYIKFLRNGPPNLVHRLRLANIFRR